VTAHVRRRFPYWKVQWRDTRSATWRDVQRAHHDRDDAVTAAHLHAVAYAADVRLMRVERHTRTPEEVDL
jgi:hypothetical protein